MAVASAVLISIVLTFAVIRVLTDWPHILDGTVPDDDFAQRYIAHPWLGYLHIAPGVIYLLGAPLQLSRRFRTKHYTVHRRLGRVLLSCALLSGVLALVFGLFHSWGGWIEASAALIFGAWFVACLVLAFRAIRRDDVPQHRRWMIRAFAVGIGIGTIRIWVGIFTPIVIMPQRWRRRSDNAGRDDLRAGLLAGVHHARRARRVVAAAYACSGRMKPGISLVTGPCANRLGLRSGRFETPECWIGHSGQHCCVEVVCAGAISVDKPVESHRPSAVNGVPTLLVPAVVPWIAEAARGPDLAPVRIAHGFMARNRRKDRK